MHVVIYISHLVFVFLFMLCCFLTKKIVFLQLELQVLATIDYIKKCFLFIFIYNYFYLFRNNSVVFYLFIHSHLVLLQSFKKTFFSMKTFPNKTIYSWNYNTKW